ncbi:PREDICTED: von Willebrand factor C and EGF domain-containing protein [Myotis brandtii]|uniref:von Willebrand factor C and EGF domain-containing protein n=1 Tax=Myotis brandtii TaxID=109478 RepID=UPI000703FD4D|nr:PREDICTED: von Willebrand factor C and EGF domain-containing protein [Myotis brandtii]
MCSLLSCRRRLGPHVCLSGFGSGCCPGWAPSMGSGHCTLPLCSFGCGRGICIAPNVCSCQDGEQGATCPDTDECLGTPCQQRCRNSIGSYTCSCRPGFHLHGNRHSCVDVNECRRPQERRGCHHACHNTVGSFLCTCRPGFRLRADRVSCEAFPTAVLAPSAILQPPPNMLLLPEASRPALSPGHPPPGAPGPPAGVRTTCPPAHTSALPAASPSVLARLPSTPMATPVPSIPLFRTLRPSSQPQEKGVIPSLPRSPTAPQPTQGPSACWHLGAMHDSGSHWTEPGCSQCWCEDGQVTCEEATCEAACSHPIPSGDGGCCPSCTGCFHGGVIRAEGAVFSPPAENCTVCVCLAGNVSCISPECPPGPCETSPESDCCTCAPGRCYFHGRWYADGAMFSGDGDACTTCACQDGEVECAFTPCPELDCPREEWWLGPGQCCFTCREPAPKTGCSLDDNGAEFPVGQIWSPGDPCELCICQADGSVSCKRTDCVDSCPHPIRIPGQCCPDCSAGCTYTGRTFLNNQTFPSVLDPCLSCICLVRPGLPASELPGLPPLLTLEPEARDLRSKGLSSAPADCNFEGRKVGNGQVFTLDDEPCTQCTCQVSCPCCWPLSLCQCLLSSPDWSSPGLEASDEEGAVPRAASAVGEPLCPFAPLSRFPGGRAGAAPSCRHGPEPPLGPPAAQPQRPTPHFLQLLLRTNVSNRQTLPRSHSGAQASPLPPAGPSPGPPTPPGASSLPPASPGAPATPEPLATVSGAHTVSRWPALPPAVLPEAPVLSTADPSPPEAPATLHGLSPATSGLSAARVVTTSPGTPQPPPRTTSEEESAG